MEQTTACPSQSKPRLRGSIEPLEHYKLNKVDLDGLELLLNLGLSERQARVYLALMKTGAARARAISNVALLSRQEVYHLLESLQQRGLVQQNLTAPASYSAIPIRDATQLLLQQKTTQLALVSQKAEGLLKKLNQAKIFPETVAASQPCFGAVCEGDRGARYLRAIKSTQRTINVITRWSSFKQICFRFENPLKTALKQDTKINITTEKPTDQLLPKWVEAALKKYPNFNIKASVNSPSIALSIFDDEQAAIAFNPNIGFSKGPTLWTSHPTLITLCNSYFIT